MKKLFACLLLLSAAICQGQSFSRYLIKFKNKATSPFSLNSPSAYLSQRAIDRRTQYGIAIDSTDLPVTPRYIDSIRLAGSVTILNVSRWLNQLSIQTSDAAALAKIASFTFVESAAPIAARLSGGRNGTQAVNTITTKRKKKARPTADVFQYGASYPQVHIHNGEFLHNIGLHGEDMIIGMMDGGFFRYTSLRAFDSVNRNGQVLGTYDFVARESSVVEDDTHGMQCFSVIAANIPGQFVGSAPKANFYLFRTEDGASEYQIEEHNWVVAAERLDSAGGDLISSSLGYSDDMSDPRFNHTYAEMNGNTTIAARGADLAAKKGILVVNSAGNQGNDAFHYIATPADGDSVLAVGAVNANGQVAPFSSFGPSADGQVKPDVASVGVATVVQSPANTISTNNGTSFSAPNIAGLATCLWQGFRELNNIHILQALRLSGSKASAPDNRVGYGIPDMKLAVLILLKQIASTSLTTSACKNTLNWTSKDVKGMKYEIERKAPGEANFTKIAERDAAGATFSLQAYQFADSLVNLPAGTFTYRIRQIIDTATGTADYIDTVSVSLAASCQATAGADAFVVMPNPTRNDISVRITSAAAIPSLTLRIVDGKGAVVLLRKTSKQAGTAVIDLPSANLASGHYYLSIYSESNLLATREFMKL